MEIKAPPATSVELEDQENLVKSTYAALGLNATYKDTNGSNNTSTSPVRRIRNTYWFFSR